MRNSGEPLLWLITTALILTAVAVWEDMEHAHTSGAPSITQQADMRAQETDNE